MPCVLSPMTELCRFRCSTNGSLAHRKKEDTSHNHQN
jgi:hypothetical protein